FYSLSRTGLAVSLMTMILMGALVVKPTNRPARGWAIGGVLLLLLIAASLLLSPGQLILRFSEFSSEGRTAVWNDTLHLVAAYPLFGCGLGGYVSAFEKFKTSAFDLVQDYAHSDYLQYLAELGAAGFAIGGALIALIWAKAIKRASMERKADRRWLALASAASL